MCTWQENVRGLIKPIFNGKMSGVQCQCTPDMNPFGAPVWLPDGGGGSTSWTNYIPIMP